MYYYVTYTRTTVPSSLLINEPPIPWAVRENYSLINFWEVTKKFYNNNPQDHWK